MFKNFKNICFFFVYSRLLQICDLVPRYFLFNFAVEVYSNKQNNGPIVTNQDI